MNSGNVHPQDPSVQPQQQHHEELPKQQEDPNQDAPAQPVQPVQVPTVPKTVTEAQLLQKQHNILAVTAIKCARKVEDLPQQLRVAVEKQEKAQNGCPAQTVAESEVSGNYILPTATKGKAA